MMERLLKGAGYLFGFLLAVGLAYATTITWSHTFSDGEVLTANQLETLKSDITAVVNAGGGPVGLTNTQTISGDKSFSGTLTTSGTFTMSGSISSGGLKFEGATADDYEVTLNSGDPAADVTITIPASTAAAGVMLTSLTTNAVDVANSVTGTSNGFIAEGTTADGFESTVTYTDPTRDNTFTWPAAEDVTVGQQVVKGWCAFTNTGTPTLTDSFNVSSLTDNAAGDTTVNWTTAFANANYSLICTAAGQRQYCALKDASAKTTTTANIITGSGDSAGQSDDAANVVAIGDR